MSKNEKIKKQNYLQTVAASCSFERTRGYGKAMRWWWWAGDGGEARGEGEGHGERHLDLSKLDKSKCFSQLNFPKRDKFCSDRIYPDMSTPALGTGNMNSVYHRSETDSPDCVWVVSYNIVSFISSMQTFHFSPASIYWLIFIHSLFAWPFLSQILSSHPHPLHILKVIMMHPGFIWFGSVLGENSRIFGFSYMLTNIHSLSHCSAVSMPNHVVLPPSS